MALTDSIPTVDGRSRRRERNAALLYDAANELLATCSFDELNVDDICARAGVGRATFFRIYETKAGLLRELNRRLARDAEDRIAADPTGDLRSALGHIRAAIVDTWRSAGPGHVGMAREFSRAVPSTDLHAAHPELFALVLRHITDAIRSGELPDTIPADLAAGLALVNLTAAVAYAIAGRDVDIDELSSRLLEQWLTGMAAVPRRAVRRARERDLATPYDRRP